MVDNRSLPPPPYHVPDPKSFDSFADWLKALTDRRRGGITQAIVAEVAGASPQSVTKWLKGGSIEAGRVERLARWLALPVQHLINMVPDHLVQLTRQASEDSLEISGIWDDLSPGSKKKLLGYASKLRKEQR